MRPGWRAACGAFAVIPAKQIAAVILIMALGLTSSALAQSAGPPPEQAKALARTRMIETLRNPESARFRNVRYTRQSDGRIIFCGEINAQNGLGGHTGYTLFVTSVTRDREVNAEIAFERNGSSRMVVASVWSVVCEGENMRPITF